MPPIEGEPLCPPILPGELKPFADKSACKARTGVYQQVYTGLGEMYFAGRPLIPNKLALFSGADKDGITGRRRPRIQGRTPPAGAAQPHIQSIPGTATPGEKGRNHG